MPDELTMALGPHYGAFEDWLLKSALPFWAGTGQDAPGLGFIEHLSLDGKPADIGYKRVRVQARQVYVYANAALLGVPGAMAAADNGYGFLTAHGWNQGGGFAHSLGRTGGILDATVDLYENAFVLFAMAWYARASGRDEPIRWAHRTLDWIEANMRTPQGEGFENALPLTSAPRLQNPHMHLLEACLALFETTGDRRFAAASLDLLALFRRRLFDPESGTVGEFYAPDWTRLGGATSGQVEPGHLYEWVWLLDAAERQLPTAGLDLGAARRAMYDFAERHGTCPANGWVVDEVDGRGTQIRRSGRLWPQTEAIKAHGAMARRGDPQAAARAARQLAKLQSRFLSGGVGGTWREHFSAEGSLIADRIPASSLYHLCMAYNELRGIMAE